MVKKKLDERVRTLIENGVKTNFRSFFVIVGDHGKDQVVNLHYILSKASVKARPSVLWCYKKELGFSTHKKKRMRQLQKQIKRGVREANQDDPFELFISATNIRWCYYKDSGKVLGTTWGMCVLQDFEALTPNLLARTVETVEGGGVVVLLLRSVRSLRQLYTMAMDAHDRFRTESHGDVVPRFNERFILSLADHPNCLVVDDELNVLPLSKHARTLAPLPAADHEAGRQRSPELAALQESLEDTPHVGALVRLCATVDQARAVLTFLEACQEKSLRATVALTAARGRGKSAALGLCLAGAVAFGYANIFLTAPSPENLGTVFEFLLKGFDALHYSEHLDYEVLQSADPALGRAVVRVNVFRAHRQTVQYVHPSDHAGLAHAELVAIDEAAAIPLPLVRKLLGPYLVFMASTVNGYEGTGRSLSLKLLQQLRRRQGAEGAAQARAAAAATKGADRRKGQAKVHEARWAAAAGAAAAALSSDAPAGRTLREVSLETPIRYGPGDPTERWLNRLLCLDAGAGAHRLSGGAPAPGDCELYYVDRDALFSYHALSEAFLQRVWGLYTAAHYRNTPNDLHLLSDAPAHHLFVLLGPDAMERAAAGGGLPDVLCVLQVVMEGQISREGLEAALRKGYRAAGDLIPWTLSQQFNDSGFAQLSGARVVRVATHPDVQRMGYGTRAMDLLLRYYRGELVGGLPGAGGGNPEEEEEEEEEEGSGDDGGEEEEEEGEEGKGTLRSEKLRPRKKLPPLLVPAEERRPEPLHWFGTSFGLTKELLGFWARAGLRAVYLRQTATDLTGEHTAVLLRELHPASVGEGPAPGWVGAFARDAQRRFLELLGFGFGHLEVSTALAVVEAQAGRLARGGAGAGEEEAGGAAEPTGPGQGPLGGAEASALFLPHDLKRLELYARNLADHHLITDLVPQLARLVFLRRLPAVKVSHIQAAILLGVGLQRKSFDQLTAELDLPVNQVMAMYNKAIRKIGTALRELQEKEVEKEMDSNIKGVAQMKKTSKARVGGAGGPGGGGGGLDGDLEEGARAALAGLGARRRAAVEELMGDLAEYAVEGTDEEWAKALADGKSKGSVQIKSKKKRKEVDTSFMVDPNAADSDDESKKKKKKKKKSLGGGGEGSSSAKKKNNKGGKKDKNKKKKAAA